MIGQNGGIPFPNDTIQYVSLVTEDMEYMANTRLRLDYVGNRVYRNGTLERLGFENGYIDGDGTYCYCLRDWQGNNRVVLAGNDSIIESDNYYPYGQHFTEGAQAAYSAQRWKFGDKEFDAEKGLNWHDFGARFLMPQFGLFTTQDPIRANGQTVSPYLYCAANPIRFIDPTGMEVILPQGPRNVSFNYKLRDVRDYIGVKDFDIIYNKLKHSKHKYYIILNSNESGIINKTKLFTDQKNEIDRIEIHLDLVHAHIFDENNIQSAAMSAYHEFGHALGIEEDFLKYLNNTETIDSQYDNAEERRIIEKVETPKAKELNEPTRTHHKYQEQLEVNDVRYHITNGKTYYGR